jgi:hypothetical protein
MNNAVNAENAVNARNVNNVCRIALNMAGVYAIQPPLSVKIMRKILWFLKRIGYLPPLAVSPIRPFAVSPMHRLEHQMPGSFSDLAPSSETREATSDKPAFSALTALPV